MKVNGKEIKPIFIIGHGRSGTTFTGRVFNQHPEIYATIEEKSWFQPFAEIAFNPNKNLKKVPELIHKQKRHLKRKCNRPVWVDKTHPLVLLREIVEEYYPEALLIHILRNPFDTYCSMIRHKGVMTWFKRYGEVFGKGGNTFLGTDENLENRYHLLTDVQKIAYRWRSWVERGLKWEKESDNVLTINYENMIQNPRKTFMCATKFLGIKSPPKWLEWISENIRINSINRYKNDMTKSNLNEMNIILQDFLNKYEQLQQYARVLEIT